MYRGCEFFSVTCSNSCRSLMNALTLAPAWRNRLLCFTLGRSGLFPGRLFPLLLSLQEPFCESRTRLCWGARGARVARQGGVLLVARGVLSGIENFFLIIMKCRDYWHKKADAPDWHIAISQIDVVMIVTVRSRLNTQKVSLCQGLRSAYGKDKWCPIRQIDIWILT